MFEGFVLCLLQVHFRYCFAQTKPKFKILQRQTADEDKRTACSVNELNEECIQVFKRHGPDRSDICKNHWTVVGVLVGQDLTNTARPSAADEDEIIELYDNEILMDRLEHFQGDCWIVIEGLNFLMLESHQQYVCLVVSIDNRFCTPTERKRNEECDDTIKDRCICGATLCVGPAGAIFKKYACARQTCCFCKRKWGHKYFKSIFYCRHETGKIIHPKGFAACVTCYPPSKSSRITDSLTFSSDMERDSYEFMFRWKQRNNKNHMTKHLQDIMTKYNVCLKQTKLKFALLIRLKCLDVHGQI